jgi:hypothetical protein
MVFGTASAGASGALGVAEPQRSQSAGEIHSGYHVTAEKLTYTAPSDRPQWMTQSHAPHDYVALGTEWAVVVFCATIVALQSPRLLWWLASSLSSIAPVWSPCGQGDEILPLSRMAPR